MASIKIEAVEITPQPVMVGAQYIIAVTVTELLAGILADDGYYIETADGLCLVREGG